MSGKLKIKHLGLEVNQNGGWSEINHRLEVPPNIRQKVFEKDKYTCQGCGLPFMRDSRRFLEVHHLNGSHADNRPANLATICPYCHMCFHLDFAGKDRQADLMFLPEMTQAEVFHIYRLKSLWRYDIESHGPKKDKKTPTSYRTKKQEEPQEESSSFSRVEDIIGIVDNFFIDRAKALSSIFQTSSPSEFAGAMRQQMRTDSDQNLDVQKQGMRHIRLLPNDIYLDPKGNDVWAAMVKSWEGCYGKESKWTTNAGRIFKNFPAPPNLANFH